MRSVSARFLIPSFLLLLIILRGDGTGQICEDDDHFPFFISGRMRCVERSDVSYLYLGGQEGVSAYLKCHSDEFECESPKRCIPSDWVQTGKVDCSWNKRQESTAACHKQTHFQCFDRQICIERWKVNDGLNDCPHWEDENLTNFKCIDQLEYKCPNNRQCIPRQWIGDGKSHCTGGLTEQAVLTCLEDEFGCLDGSRCLPLKYRCDGIQNCRDGSDEMELCSVPTMYRCVANGTKLIPWSLLLQDRIQYENIDLYCNGLFNIRGELMLGMKCRIKYVNERKQIVSSIRRRNVPQVYIENNISLCTDGDDLCFDGGGEFTCARCLDGTIISVSQLCNGVIDCRDLSDECACIRTQDVRELCDKVYPQHMGNPAVNLSLICNGVVDLDGGLDETFCDDQVLQFDIIDVEERRHPGNATETKFYCRNGEFIAASEVDDGWSDCTDRSDECTEGEYSTQSDMIGNPILILFIWISAFSIFATNLLAIMKQTRKMRKATKTERHLWHQSFAFCGPLLLTNLALADTIFGVTLLILGVKAYQFSGRYCEFDIEWRSSSTCNLVGVLAIISSLTSMNILALVTALRLFVTSNPVLQKYLRYKPLWSFCALSWIVSLCLGLIPIAMNDIFTQGLILGPNLFLKEDVVLPDQMETYIARTNQMTSSIPSLDHSHTVELTIEWYFNTEDGRTRFPNRNVEVRGTFGYYSSSSICFPHLFSHNPTPAMIFSLSIITCFIVYLVFICTSYFLIYRKVKALSMPIPGGIQNSHVIRRREKRNADMVRRIICIVCFELLCWLPIIVLTFLSYAGVELAVGVHPLFVLVVFPLKSFLNPIIYSRLDASAVSVVRKMRSCWVEDAEIRESEVMEETRESPHAREEQYISTYL